LLTKFINSDLMSVSSPATTGKAPTSILRLAEVDFGCQQPQTLADDEADIDRAALQRALFGLGVVKQRVRDDARVRGATQQRVEIAVRGGMERTVQAAGHDRRVGLDRDQRLDQLVRGHRHKLLDIRVLALELAEADSQPPVLRLKRPH
jgi:hypothetical protein